MPFSTIDPTTAESPGTEVGLPTNPQHLGTSDWVAERSSIEWIAEIVNRALPGHGAFVALDSSDHFYKRAESMQESLRYFKPATEGPFGEFNPAIFITVCDWLDETVAMSKQEEQCPVNYFSKSI